MLKDIDKSRGMSNNKKKTLGPDHIMSGLHWDSHVLLDKLHECCNHQAIPYLLPWLDYFDARKCLSKESCTAQDNAVIKVCVEIWENVFEGNSCYLCVGLLYFAGKMAILVIEIGSPFNRILKFP